MAKADTALTGADAVSIIIPSYNHGQYIRQAIDSVLNQTHKNWELIIIDDGSADDTHEVLSQYQHHPKIRIRLHQHNRGQTVRLNEALDMARGQYISFLPSDDWYLPEKLEKQLALFGQLPENYGVVYSQGLRYFEDTGEMQPAKTNEQLRRGHILGELLVKPFFVYPNTPLIRKVCFEHYRFDPSYFAEGEAIYFKIAMRWLFDFVPEPLTVMRDHSYNTGKMTQRMFEDNLRYRQELFAHPDFPPDLQPLKNTVLARLYRLKGWEMIRKNKADSVGIKLLTKAFQLEPFSIKNWRVFAGMLLYLSGTIGTRVSRIK
jgi:glycosyltransferase involved in cell wall biosynthesis